MKKPKYRLFAFRCAILKWSLQRESVYVVHILMMDFSGGSHPFWKILESNLKIKIPDHVKNILSAYQVGNAIAFSEMTDEDINLAEKFAREELNELLVAQLGRELNIEEKSAFFGIYAGCPEKFRFLGNRKLIQQMVQHVQLKLQESPDSFELKNEMTNKKRNHLPEGTVQTALGLVFGNRKILQNSTNRVQSEISHEKATASLFAAAKKLFQLYEEDALFAHGDISPPFTKDMINITFNENNDIKAAITCQFCSRETKVHIKRSVTGFSWVLSNLKSHIITCLKSKPKPIVREEGYESDLSLSGDFLSENNQNHERKTKKKSTKSESVQQTTVQLKIEPVGHRTSGAENSDPVSDLENDLYSQISIQNIKMINTAVKHKESKKKCKVNVNGIGYIDVCLINGDGNCAFSVIAHQMFNAKVNSLEHMQQTQKLRADVVQYIKENLSLFSHEIKGRLYESNELTDNFDDDCGRFLDELAQDGYYGGKESLKAITFMYKVNIIIFNESGDCYSSDRFNLNNETTVLMAFRGDGLNLNRNHYDSVVGLKSDTLKSAVNVLLKMEMKYIQNKDSKDTVVV